MTLVVPRPAGPIAQLRHDLHSPGESFWLNHCEWLEEKGYLLRPRYRAGWVPSWEGTKRSPSDCEDGQRYRKGFFEVEIGTWFSEEPQRSDPENYCVPIYEVLQSPHDRKVQIIVMPLLTRFDKPRFDTIGEAVSFFRQIFQGMRYMHKHNVAHRDAMYLNIMMDPSSIVTQPFHPVKPTMKRDFSGKMVYLSRTRHPVKYYFTDFGFSRRYRPEDRPPLETPIIGGDHSVPEFQADDAPKCDPFPVDVYYLGNLIREDFIVGRKHLSRKRGFEFMEPLVADMVNEDPSKRPTIDAVVDRFEEIVGGLSSWKLRSRVAKDKHYLFAIPIGISHWARRLQLVVGGYAPIPMP